MSVRDQLINLMMSDAVNAARTQDALREALMGALVQRSQDMSPEALVDAISRVGSLTNLDQYERLANLLSRTDSLGANVEPPAPAVDADVGKRKGK